MIRLIAAPPDAVLPGGTIDAQKGYPTADDTPEGLAHLTAHQSLSEIPLTIYRVRRDATWWVIVPDGTTLLTSLPGDIPGLLQRGSAVFWRDEATPWNVLYIWRVCDDDPLGGENVLIAPCSTPAMGLEDSGAACVLDLTDPTGRSHAARWAYHHPRTQGYTGLTHDEHAAMETALHYDPMTPEQIDTLARLVRRLAGRAA